MGHNTGGDGRNINTAEQNWESSIEFGSRSNTYKLVRALLSQAERLDDEIEDVYHSQHINTATGEELEQFGKLVDTPRNNGEPDEKYRSRIKAEFAQSRIGTDFDSFAEFCASVLSTDPTNIEFITNYGGDPATVTVSADSSLYESVSLTPTEVNELLSGGVPAGHEVAVQETGSFRLKVDGESDTAEQGLTSDSIQTGGTLAVDLV